jgi:hypothetical protein
VKFTETKKTKQSEGRFSSLPFFQERLTLWKTSSGKDLIIRAFRNGLFQNPSIVEELKSSSLIESDYFEDED